MNKQNSSVDTSGKTSGKTTKPLSAEKHASEILSIGFIAIAYVISMIVQNLLFSNAPSYSDPIGALLTFHAENQSILRLIMSLETTNMVLLLLFLTKLHGLVKRRSGLGEDWSRLAMIAGSTLSALFALLIASHISVIVAANNITEPNFAFEMMWQFNAAIFGLAMPALGLTFIGTALATHKNGLTRKWQLIFALVGGNLPIISGFGNLGIATGSPFLYVGVFGVF